MSSFDDLLAQCLNDIEAGKTTIDECLKRHPEQSQALRPLLRTAVSVRNAPVVEPSPGFQGAAQTRMLNLIAARQHTVTPVPARNRRRWSTVLVRVTVAAVLASLLLVGTAYAARDSMPDSPLYPVKRTVEQMQVAVAPNDTRKARVFVNLMDQRALETAAMIRRGNVQRSRDTAQHYDRILQEAVAVTQSVPASRPEGRAFLVYMREHLLAQQVIFQRVVDNTPERARPLLRPTLQSIQSTIDRVNAQLDAR